MNAVPNREQLVPLTHLSPQELLRWAWQSCGERAAIITSFQNTGCVMIDMARQVAPQLRILTVDTLRLPQETYALMDALEAKYGIAIERFKPDPQRLEHMIQHHGEYLFFDSPEKQKHCCFVRKVEPNNRALDTVDIWITGLRRDQSTSRMVTPKAVEFDLNGRTIAKLCPLIDWSDDQVNAYLVRHGVPHNTLYDRGYTSIGCVICSTPTRPGEDKRAGRWRWWNHWKHDDHKECGIHVDGSGI